MPNPSSLNPSPGLFLILGAASLALSLAAPADIAHALRLLGLLYLLSASSLFAIRSLFPAKESSGGPQ